MSDSAAVSTWSGDPSEFESFVIARRWFEKALKPSERTQAAPKIWARLTGPAKAVVKHLDPDEFASDEGLQRLLTVLRTSPLQQLPVPDSFKRLDVWHHLKRGQQESIPELLVREEDLFVQLQQALKRARQDRNLLSHADLVRDPVARPPPSTPSQSPINLTGSRYADRIPPDAPQEARDRAPGGDASTSFEDAEQSRGWTRKQQVWWNEDAGYDQSHEDHWIEEWPYDDWYGDPGHDEEAFWHAWPGHDEEWMEDSPWSEWPPDELPGSGKGFGKGFKGKSKKGKGYGKPIQFHSLTVPLFPLHVYFKEQVQGCRVIIDTGASENAVGSTALQRMLEASGLDHEVTTADRPVFRFGNGLQAQAKRRVDLKGTSLGSISFYVLGNEAHQTPPLMGGKTLRELKAMLAYERNLFLYQAPHEETWEIFGPDSLGMDKSKQPCAVDDPRALSSFPCFGEHKPKMRQNQYASWMTCQACGLRTSYVSKRDFEGDSRHMGPHPHLISAALEQLRQTMPASQVSEKMNGKVMELKGIQLQQGLTNTQAINMTFPEYCRRMGISMKSNPTSPAREKSPASPAPKAKIHPTAAGLPIPQTELLKMAAAKFLESLDPEEISEFVTGQKTKEEILASRRTIKKFQKEPKEEVMGAISIASSEEEPDPRRSRMHPESHRATLVLTEELARKGSQCDEDWPRHHVHYAHYEHYEHIGTFWYHTTWLSKRAHRLCHPV
ncbi:Uncharacterized protein SCF082_LOCUS116 [Durusdinium trenchii]|uniref:Peptidase A2 domain-containing protein n=1 Tax=Durusdinium trenchii TaxID=1381693 RepID=A0ABP0H5Z0_9DINO